MHFPECIAKKRGIKQELFKTFRLYYLKIENVIKAKRIVLIMTMFSNVTGDVA